MQNAAVQSRIKVKAPAKAKRPRVKGTQNQGDTLTEVNSFIKERVNYKQTFP